jgi:hypothetical protein
MENDYRSDTIRGLRELADFLDAYPDVPVPYSNELNVFAQSKETLARLARLTSWQKQYCGGYFALTRSFGDGMIVLSLNIERQVVCRQIVVGERVVPAQPAQPERIEPITEWVCDDALLSPQASA